MNTPKLALWDIDGTLAYPSLERQFVAFLLRTGRLRSMQIAGRALRLAFQGRLSVHRMKLPYVQGEPVERVQEWVERWWQEEGLRQLLPGAARTLRLMQERGIEVLLVSGTADFLAERLARHFEGPACLAGRAEIASGCYTGSLVEPHPRGRAKLVYAEAYLAGRPEVWMHSCALADHEGDVALLARTALPVAVNPRPGLRAEAARRGWLVVTDAELPDALASRI